ncbi:hypothetical protein SAMN05216381_0984 [Pseudomonas seleniipraecipitans]|uniref:Uncharacterized protein n=1 Tax=Phytopseudomonas seleniipraecipitans TaxID=640205 RepID=A0A1G7J4G7_9GAMM|nr:hypothetical protein SAMN05216381_0984 [Pseudomonas seleniipraecipitans]
MELSQRLRRFLLMICQSRSGQCLAAQNRRVDVALNVHHDRATDRPA